MKLRFYLQANDGEFYNFSLYPQSTINKTSNTSYKALVWGGTRRYGRDDALPGAASCRYRSPRPAARWIYQNARHLDCDGKTVTRSSDLDNGGLLLEEKE